MGRPVFNPALSDLRAEMESALEGFRAKYNADAMLLEMKEAVARGNLDDLPARLAAATLREFHRHYRCLVAWEEEAIRIVETSGRFDPVALDRMRLTIEYTKRREGFLWLEILSFSDESFARTLQPSQQQEELCLF